MASVFTYFDVYPVAFVTSIEHVLSKRGDGEYHGSWFGRTFLCNYLDVYLLLVQIHIMIEDNRCR